MKLRDGIRLGAAALPSWLGCLAIFAALDCGSSAPSSAPANGDEAGVGGEGGGAPSSDAASSSSCGATVTQGGLKGKLAGTTCEYLGIPYGAPPTGNQRFMPPQPAPGWSTTRDATAFGKSCVQAGPGLGNVGMTGEDCLFVNVFTPQTTAAQPLPVMVFIHGGAFTTGGSSVFDGQPLSEKGVVLVTINYRLGALGFLALPELDGQRPMAPSGSDGIRDQQLALKWVHDNIAAFHGDANNVTVFGESAGSTSTCLHIVSPGSQGFANRYIMESLSCVGGSPELNTKAQAYQISGELAASFCGGGGGASDGGASDGGASDGGAAPLGADALACLRLADPGRLMSWVPPTSGSSVGAAVGSLLGPPFAPIVEGPGGVLPDTPAHIIASGSFNKNAQVLAGTNKNEWGLFVGLATNPTYGGSASSPLNVTTVAQLDDAIGQQFGAAASEIEAQYPATDVTAGQVYVDLVTDYGFRCPTRDLARAMTAQGTKAYYLYSYDIGPAWHAFELEALFNLTALGQLGATVPSKTFGDEMLGYWTRFAATGDPNRAGGADDAGAPSPSPTWPAYTAASDEYYLQLLDPTPVAVSKLRQAQCDFWASFTPSVTSSTADAGSD